MWDRRRLWQRVREVKTYQLSDQEYRQQPKRCTAGRDAWVRWYHRRWARRTTNLPGCTGERDAYDRALDLTPVSANLAGSESGDLVLSVGTLVDGSLDDLRDGWREGAGVDVDGGGVDQRWTGEEEEGGHGEVGEHGRSWEAVLRGTKRRVEEERSEGKRVKESSSDRLL
jgi:hypothetical protein